MSKIKEYDLLKKIINEEDPIGLVDFDTPESLSEYDPELKEILKRDVSSLSNKELGQWIYQVFEKYFNKELAGEKEKYDVIAAKFLSVVNKK